MAIFDERETERLLNLFGVIAPADVEFAKAYLQDTASPEVLCAFTAGLGGPVQPNDEYAGGEANGFENGILIGLTIGLMKAQGKS